MSKEELLAEAKRRRLLEQVKARRAEQTASQESEMSDVNKARGAVQSYLRGATLGWGDEIAGGVRSVLPGARETYDFGGDVDMTPQSLGDTYRMYRDDERAVTQQFEDDYGKTALALNVAGGLASPINRVGPGLGGASRQAQLARALSEGGAVGAGEALEASDMLDEAVKGAGTAGGMNVALGTLGKVAGKTIFGRHVDEDLVDAATGQRKPIHMAAGNDSVLGRVYAETVGRIPGAKQALQRQEQPYVDAAADAVYDTAERLRGAVDDVRLSSAAEKAAAKTAARARTERITTGLERAKDRATQAAAQAQDAAAGRFRQDAARASLPSSVQGLLDEVDIDNPNQVREVIGDWWKTRGFSVVKNNIFPWGKKGIDKNLQRELKAMVAEDPQLQLELGNAVGKVRRLSRQLNEVDADDLDLQDMSMEEVMRLFDTDDAPVDIDGESLMAIRNVFATAANGSAKNGSAARKVATKIDDFIRENMDPAEVAEFNENIGRYTTGLTYMDVTRKAPVREAGGLFTPNQWMSTSGKYGGKGMSLKQAPLDDLAVPASRAGKEAKDALPGAKKRYDKAAARAKQRVADEKAARLTAATNKETAAKEYAKESARRGGELYEAREQLRELSDLTVPDKTSGLSQLLTADVLGSSVIPGVPNRSRGARVAQGMAVGRALASDTAQDLLAGQTQLQQQARAALMRGDLAEYNRLIGRMSAMAATGE